MRSPGRACQVIAALLMAVYVAAVLAGKLAIVGGTSNPIALGDVGEFLVVLGSIVFFVTGILAAPASDHKGGEPR